jgi:uncharacterized protein YndB with AHSA1/START domain
MKDEPIVVVKTVNAPAAKVWKALTDKDEMKKWYFDIPEFKPVTGLEFQFVGGDEENQFLHLCKVMEVIPGKKLAHTWRYEGYEGNTLVTFELFDEGNETTTVKLTHEGVETFPKIPSFKKENFVGGWNQIIGVSLPKFLEENKQ